MECKYCNKVAKTIRSKSQHELYCIENPNRKIRTSGFKGKKHTSEVRERCRRCALKQWEDGLGVIPDNFNVGRPHTEESKCKISNALMGNNNGKHRGDRQSYYKGIRMDSSWEVLTAEYLYLNSIQFIYGEVIFNLEPTTYRPDFYLPELDSFIEVKGYWRQANLEKFAKFRSMYPDVKIEVWDKHRLKELGIL